MFVLCALTILQTAFLLSHAMCSHVSDNCFDGV